MINEKSKRLDAKAVYRALNDDATCATVLHIICLVSYGEEVYRLDPIELYLRFDDDYHSTITEDNKNKIQAILLATSTDIFFQQTEAFNSICHTLASGDPGIELLEEPTLPEIMWGMYEVELNHGPGEPSAGVQRAIYAAIEKEAHDGDEPGGPLDYVKNYLQEAHSRLKRQLDELGVESSHLPPIDPQGQPAALAGTL